MVVEIAGSTIIVAVSTAAALMAAGAVVYVADVFDSGSITNITIHAWDRFGVGSEKAWVEVTLTYPGGPLEITGDFDLCLVPPDGATACEIVTCTPPEQCPAPCNTTTANEQHNCVQVEQSGSAKRVTYEGVVDLGFDIESGDPLGYAVVGPRHGTSGSVGVR